MKLSYAQCISKAPIYIPYIGHVHSPTLQEIYDLGFNSDGKFIYEYYLNILAMTPKDWFENFKAEDLYLNLSDEEKADLNMFLIILNLSDGIDLLTSILSFFIVDTITFDNTNKCFIVSNEEETVGVISKDNYKEVCNIILQLNYIETEDKNSAKPKNKIAEKILKKLSQQKKKTNTNIDINIPNLISKVCCNHNSYNFTNIWSLTVFQLYDQFYCLNNKICIDSTMKRWAIWGSEPFDFNIWFKQNK